MDEQNEILNENPSENDSDAMSVLHSLEAGQIDIEEAERLLSRQVPPADQASDTSGLQESLRWNSWWLVLFVVGFAFAMAGWGVATLGGWWWLCASPLLFVGIVVTILAVTSMQSPWVHLRVYEHGKSRTRKFAISLPIPVRLAAWVLKHFGQHIKDLEKTGVDDLLLALDALEGDLSRGDPIVIDIDDEHDGESIQILMG